MTGQLNDTYLRPEDKETLRTVIEYPAGIVVMGTKAWAKAAVVNELLGYSLLPVCQIFISKLGILPFNFFKVEQSKAHTQWRTIRFAYGNQTSVSLSVANCYELVEHLAVYDRVWQTIPIADLEIEADNREKDPGYFSAILEIKLQHPLLKDDVHIIVSPNFTSFEEIYTCCFEGVMPIIVYAIAYEDEVLPTLEVQHLNELRRRLPNSPVFFVRTKEFFPSYDSPSCSLIELSVSELTESQQHLKQSTPATEPLSNITISQAIKHKGYENMPKVYHQICKLGFLESTHSHLRGQLTFGMANRCRKDFVMELNSEYLENFENFSSFLLFVRQVMQTNLISVASLLHDLHIKCLRMFILSAFDMTWDMQITPKRLSYVRRREEELYSSLMGIANRKQEEIKQLITETIDFMRSDILNQAANHEFTTIIDDINNVSSRDLQLCMEEIQDLVLTVLNNAIAAKLVGSVDYMRDSFVGTLERCIRYLETSQDVGEPFGTLCAFKQILNAAYQIEVNVKTSYSLLRVLWEKMKQLVSVLPWKPQMNIDAEWKKKIANDILTGLSESRLAKTICLQFKERLKLSHEQFSVSLKQLESVHVGRLEKTGEHHLKVRKHHAPRLARFALETTSLIDVILYGMPQMGREIGRGQYGVVYSCDYWAGHSPCALKSVVPPDDKHWNDLAMEFHYTRSIPEHERIVQIRGSVIDYSYGTGSTPAVWLVMERLTRDLHAAIKNGLDWLSRLQVAIDVVEGIRYLHSQGLVHRDIKLKNVLLDKKNRAKITDLGFCKPEAMMSGSIVGTPIHMAPELFTGHYDNMVDVYAFGILFWYICAGHVRLPYIFEQCQSKDQLWNAVKKGKFIFGF